MKTHMNIAAKRIARIASASLALSLLTTPVIAQSVLTADTEISGDAYLNRLAEIMNDIRNLVPDTVEGEGPLLTILPETGDVGTELGALSDADRQLVRAGRRLFDLYREVGGNPGGRPLLIQRTANGLFSALQGENGNVSAQPGEALAGSLNDIAASDERLPGAVAPVVAAIAETLASAPNADAAFDLLAALEPDPIAVLSRNQRVGLTITGPDIETAGRFAVVAGPAGSTVGRTTVSGDTLTTNIVIGPETADGFGEILLFSGTDSLTPVTSYDIAVRGGETTPPDAEPDDHGGTTATATPLLGGGAISASVTGHIGSADDVDMFSLTVTAPGNLTIASSGPTDITATLSDSNGTLVASDDNNGSRYNFAVQSTVNPGTYVLTVRHCCSGSGRYQLDTVLNPL